MRKLLSILFISTVFFACKDEEKKVYAQSAKDQTLCEMITMDAFEQVLTITPSYIIDGKYEADTSIIITASPILSDPTYPKVITIDFGSGITGPDGKTREGKIKVTINSGTVLTENLNIEFDDYVAEGNTVYGVIDYSYATTNNVISYAADMGQSGLTFVSANGTMKWKGDFTIQRNSGSTTPSIGDDVFSLSGSTTGVDISGTSYSVTTKTDHTIDFSCKNIITAGTSDITPNGKGKHTVDYGNLECNTTATISLSASNSQNFNF